jgi:hypothetical protein
MKYVGDFNPGASVGSKFNTHQADGTPITLAGTPAVSVYKKGTTTESMAGVTLTVDYDSRTGLHDIVIDTTADGTFYAAGNDFDVAITAGTVNSISVVGTVLFTFSLENRNIKANLIQSLGVAVTNSDFTLAAVGASNVTVTLPAAYTNGDSLPDDDRYEYAVLSVVGGAGAGQTVLLTTAGASARQYNVLSGTAPTTLDATSQCVVLGAWRASAIQAEGTVLSGTVESTGTTPTNIVIKTISPALTVTDQVKGRVILFKTDTTTAALRGQGAPIDGSTTTAITLAAGDALTTAPAEDDEFCIV